MEAVDAYDPFELYRGYEESRDAWLPPHLVFASLRPFRRPRRLLLAGETSEEAKLALASHADEDASAAFLLAYGWPLETNARTPKSHDSAIDVQEVRTRQIWREKLNGKLPLEPASATKNSEVWTSMRLDKFWEQQQRFALVAQSLAVFRSAETVKGRNVGIPTDTLKDLFMSVLCFPVGISGRGHVSWPLLGELASLLQIGTIPPHFAEQKYWHELQKHLIDKIQARKSSIVSIASSLVRGVMAERLKPAMPILDYDDVMQRFGCTWNCATLLDAFYIMLFLDVEYGRRVLRCEGCGILFSEVKQNVTHCSDRCGNRVRVRRTTSLMSSPRRS